MESSASSDESDAPTEFKNAEIQPTNENEVSLSERELIRKQISTMSFEELQKLKTRVGLKAYNEVVFDLKSKKTEVNFKRANKNRPREMSSKKRVKTETAQVKVKPVKSFTPRDPRFDPLCGEFDNKLFKSNYKFLKDVKHQERKQLDVEYKNETDDGRKDKIKLLMQRIDNQTREEENLKKRTTLKETESKDIKEKLKKGEKPVYKKKSEKRMEDLVNKYEELKKNNKLEKHMKKHAKKVERKDRRLNNFL